MSDVTATDRTRTRIERFLEERRYLDLGVGWDAVVGHDHAKRELSVIVESLRRRDIAEQLGIPLVKGVLVTGPSGTGKTLLARAFAGALERPVFVLSAAELTPRRIARIYEVLSDQPCVIVIDEIDLIAQRSYRGHARSRTVGALCVALDGLVPITGPVTLALTAGDPEELDPSIIRSGRLTTKIILKEPDRAERLVLWRRALDRIASEGDLGLEEVADRSQGLTGADIVATALAAAGLALADGRATLDRAHLDEAIERRGFVRRRAAHDDRIRRATAIHEAGHAVFAFRALGADALNDIAVSASVAGSGHMALRNEWAEAHGFTGRLWRLRVQLSLAGLVAEEAFNQPDGLTMGSQVDINEATGLVLTAAEHGLLGWSALASPTRMERGPDPASYDDHGSPRMRDELWVAVKRELDEAHVACRVTLEPHRAAVESLAARVLAEGTLSGVALAVALRATGIPEGADDV